MKIGDKVQSNGIYPDIQSKLGDSIQTIRYVGHLPGCRNLLIWLDCGGGCFCADGFRVVEKEGVK